MKTFKNYLVGGATFILLLTLVACSEPTSEKSAAEAKLITEQDTVFIGFLLDTLQDERWYNDKELFEEEVANLGGRVKTLAANGLDDVQISQAELLIEEGVDVLVVVPRDAAASAAIVELAHEADVKVISYDRLITNSDLDYYISFDNERVGELQAQEIVNNVDTGNFAYIGGAESDNNAILFRQGAMNILQPLIDSGDIELVYDQYTEGWNPDVAEENMLSALDEQGDDIDAVVAANDGTAGGVINALSTVGLDGEIPVSGQDAELNAVRRIVDGTQTMTVYKSINTLAVQAAEMAFKVAAGDDIPTETTVNNGQIDVPSILLEPITVTENNIDETIIQDGYLSEEDIYTTP
ncbi:substrate-binding domain-containing protein [Salipaludibacillus agaradhaerens]|uniref:sugar ABC transporter substrate-binding protein n=1 Tax=Salipaludibacillus agaradhaerens TaxID=76935 RepID=UPI002150CB3C|nr:substrate-binding domain-containing protein [Salipaludibacillus agaradhaerens]MCR6105480.1 substrate-binding domain-containing protein [Salipaludibacillus agaradhaerens]MCR6117518.1 substrate-binding domain-containing protein [Salipaludibacillus agaradhaerens]UJW56706.1 substrate-binding domain-containing protein [Bacillus sp. A116_S68]